MLYAFGRNIVTGKRTTKGRMGGVIVMRFFMQVDAIARGLTGSRKL